MSAFHLTHAVCRLRRRWQRPAGWRPALTAALLFFALVPFARAQPAADFADQLAALAAKCDELGLNEQAQITRRWNIARHPRRQYLFLPADGDSTAPKASSPEAARQWHRRFLELRRQQAELLFHEAGQACSSGNAARAYPLLFEVLHEDPDHAEARRVLGYVKRGNQWQLPDAEKQTVRQPAVDHPTLGWRARSYYSLETSHFRIVSPNQSKAEILEAGQQLESLHALWRQIFFRYWSTPQALAARLAGGHEPLAAQRPKMQVVLFANRQQYSAQVAAAHPKATETLGLYDNKQRIAYFYGGDKSVYPTWFHEAAHQLFQEAVPGTRDEPGQQRNFWALEGAALYLESLTQHAGYWTVGGCEADRLQFARYRVLSGDLALPLAALSGMSRDDIQNSGEIGRIYTQAAGLSHFLIDGAGGQYRDPFIDLLTTIYQGRDTADSLGQLVEQPLAKLDEQYRAFLDVTDGDLTGIPDVSRLRNLSLCRTAVSDRGLSKFAGTKNLVWIDMSHTACTDAGLGQFANNTGLKQLFLEGSQITAAALSTIAGFKQLEQLDLSRLPIGDDSLAALAPLRGLKTLYLTGCPLSDAALVHLRGLKQLEDLETSGTQITADGLKRLRSLLPKLKLANP